MNDEFKRNKSIDELLEAMASRSKSLNESNKLVSSCYMACLTGMWTHALHRANVSPFKSDGEGELDSWFSSGYKASVEASGITQEEYKKMEEERKKKQKEDIKKYNEEMKRQSLYNGENKKKSGSFWNTKFFNIWIG